MKQKLPKKEYCGYCGAEMLAVRKPANEIKVFHYDSGGGSEWDLGNRFNRETGKPQYGYKFICPNYKSKKWYHIFSPHDKFSRDVIYN